MRVAYQDSPHYACIKAYLSYVQLLTQETGPSNEAKNMMQAIYMVIFPKLSRNRHKPHMVISPKLSRNRHKPYMAISPKLSRNRCSLQGPHELGNTLKQTAHASQHQRNEEQAMTFLSLSLRNYHLPALHPPPLHNAPPHNHTPPSLPHSSYMLAKDL